MHMIKLYYWLTTLAIFILVQTNRADEVKIAKVSGEVRVRRGVETTWHPVSVGIFIKDVDTILTGEKGKVVLELENGNTFVLSSNSILDVADLRKITDRQLFLYLVKSKVNQLEKHPEKTELRLGKVSVVHGENRDTTAIDQISVPAESWTPIINGALALYQQQYYPNAIMKLNKILDAGLPRERWCEAYFYLGHSFEAINKPGQAIDAYQIVVDECADSNPERAGSARASIERLEIKE
jgi:hypothetical protein